MNRFNGLGLSAIQVGEIVRVMLMAQEDPEHPLVLINPVITKTCEKKELMKEGCLSFPGIVSKVDRATVIDVTYNDAQGGTHTETFKDVFAQCVQHEIDHMDGVLFVERVSPIYRISLADKLKHRRF
jgi:peptide deformylase